MRWDVPLAKLGLSGSATVPFESDFMDDLLPPAQGGEDDASDSDEEVIEVEGSLVSEKYEAWEWEEWIEKRRSFEGSYVFRRFRVRFRDNPRALAWVAGYEKWDRAMRLPTELEEAESLTEMFLKDVVFQNHLINYYVDLMRSAESDHDRQMYGRLLNDAVKTRSLQRPRFPQIQIGGNGGLPSAG